MSGLRLYGFSAILGMTAYFTAFFHFSRAWGPEPLLFVFALIVASLIVSGISLQSTVFACIATLPTLNSYIPFPSFSLTVTEIFMALFVAVFVMKNTKIIVNQFVVLVGCLFLACAASLIGSPLGLASLGMLLRYGVLLFFVSILASRSADKSLFKPFFLGLLAIPFVACCAYAGEGLLLVMLRANLLGFSRVIYSFQYPIWFSLLLPLAVFVRAPRLVVAAVSLFVVAIITLSFARSIVIGTTAASLLFIVFYRNTNRASRIASKALLLVTLGIVLTLVVARLNYFDFITAQENSTGQSGSNASRYRKMAISLEKIKDHPYLGLGFGAANDGVFAEREARTEVYWEGMNPEFGPLHVLAEIGAVGAFFLLTVIVVSFRCSVKCLRDRNIPTAYKMAVLITFGGFVSSFLNANSLNLMTIYIFLVMPVILFNHRRGAKEGPALAAA